jgi:hypothetical protein
MKPKYLSNGMIVVAVAATLTTGAGAQVQTTTSVESGKPAITTAVEHGEVVRVSGNDLIVKMEDGTIRDFPNIPESAKATVDGQEFTIHDLKPGMKLQRTITTTTTPRVVTTVATVKGKVLTVTPPLSVVLTLEDGTNQAFTIPKDQKFNIDGEMVDAFGLRTGMVISATKIVETPDTVIAQQQKVTGTLSPRLALIPTDEPILLVISDLKVPK